MKIVYVANSIESKSVWTAQLYQRSRLPFPSCPDFSSIWRLKWEHSSKDVWKRNVSQDYPRYVVLSWNSNIIWILRVAASLFYVKSGMNTWTVAMGFGSSQPYHVLFAYIFNCATTWFKLNPTGIKSIEHCMHTDTCTFKCKKRNTHIRLQTSYLDLYSIPFHFISKYSLSISVWIFKYKIFISTICSFAGAEQMTQF